MPNLRRLALAAGFALQTVLLVPNTAAADQSSPVPAAASTPEPSLTARFATFIATVLAGQLPASGITDTMKTAFTPAIVEQVKTNFAPLGSFQRLQFTREDGAAGFQRFHYIAIFDKGTQAVIFVLDSNQNIAGFFADQGQ